MAAARGGGRRRTASTIAEARTRGARPRECTRASRSPSSDTSPMHGSNHSSSGATAMHGATQGKRRTVIVSVASAPSTGGADAWTIAPKGGASAPRSVDGSGARASYGGTKMLQSMPNGRRSSVAGAVFGRAGATGLVSAARASIGGGGGRAERLCVATLAMLTITGQPHRRLACSEHSIAARTSSAPGERLIRLDILRPLAVVNLRYGAVRFHCDCREGKSLPL